MKDWWMMSLLLCDGCVEAGEEPKVQTLEAQSKLKKKKKKALMLN